MAAPAFTFEGLYDLTEIVRPPDRVPLSVWAEENFILSPEYSARSGLIVLESWQREMLDAFTDPAVNVITLMTAVQLIKTLFMQVASAYTIIEDPAPILFVGYKDGDADRFSNERITPMIRDMPDLSSRIGVNKSGKSVNTVASKIFRGGAKIDFVGSLSASNLGGRTICILLFDEIDKFDISAGKEGDPIAIAERRTIRFGSRRKVVKACSPTVKGSSRIEASYDDSDQRKPYVACHHCGAFQLLLWSQVQFMSSLPIGEAARSARYECAECRQLWTNVERVQNLRRAIEWRANKPFTGHAGFWISHLYSTLLLHSLEELTREFLEAERSHNRERLKVFINTNLAELWEDEGERPAWDIVQSRAENYQYGPDCVIPQQAVFLTAGVDVQAKRLELQILAHGPDEHGRLHAWCIDYRVIELFEDNGMAKMVSHPDYWDQLALVMESRYSHQSGVKLSIVAMSVDVGYDPDPVYEFAKRYPRPSYGAVDLRINQVRTVLCVRGYDSDSINAIHNVTERERARQRKNKGKDLPIITLGTGYLKQDLYSDLHGHGSTHTHLSRFLSEDYFKGLCAEKRLISPKTGEISWVKLHPRNEPLDTWVYAMGARAAFKVDRFSPDMWRRLRIQMGLPPEVGGVVADKPAEDIEKRPARPVTVPSPYL